ncbi:MAG TPA: glycosyltransferase [Candidatus Gastranaerophilaceae bacterium]|nr:glycosyltransferase [Candidatus Gastranaerophilaceae bacterium]
MFQGATPPPRCSKTCIPSIWPETFSYTTAEAMMLKYPVACFDIGAPAQRVKNYDKGVVISKIDAQTALDEIVNFLRK